MSFDLTVVCNECEEEFVDSEFESDSVNDKQRLETFLTHSCIDDEDEEEDED